MNSDRSLKAEDILTPQQLAERLQVGVSWVYEKSRRRGEHTEKPLPVLHCGRYSTVLLAGRLRMDAKWNQRASSNPKEDDLIHWAKMKRTRYSSRYSRENEHSRVSGN
jgi:hypothetical protein